MPSYPSLLVDANRQRFWLLTDGHHWTVGDGARYDAARRVLRLASVRHDDALEDRATAEDRLAIVPAMMDAYGHHAVWRAGVGRGAGTVFAGPSPDDLVRLGWLDFAPSDLCLGRDGVLYVIGGGALNLFDLRDRFEPVRLEAGPRLRALARGGAPVEGVASCSTASTATATAPSAAPLPRRPGARGERRPGLRVRAASGAPTPRTRTRRGSTPSEPGLGPPLSRARPGRARRQPRGPGRGRRVAGHERQLMVRLGGGEVRHPPLLLEASSRRGRSRGSTSGASP
ncbi:MAG: hypothetical protein R3F65_18120 [bacterium]